MALIGQPKDAVKQLAKVQEQTSVLLERLVVAIVAIEAMSSLVIRQEGHIYLTVELAQQTTGVAAEAGCMCMEHQLGAEAFTQCWDSWESRFRAEMS
jgi:uncharacterized protein GlcG (DUF336 family)